MVLGIVIEASDSQGRFGGGVLSGFSDSCAYRIEALSSSLATRAAVTFVSKVARLSTVKTLIVFTSFIMFFLSEFLGFEGLDICISGSLVLGYIVLYLRSRASGGTWSQADSAP